VGLGPGPNRGAYSALRRPRSWIWGGRNGEGGIETAKEEKGNEGKERKGE